jgi:hypothetical protein
MADASQRTLVPITLKPSAAGKDLESQMSPFLDIRQVRDGFTRSIKVVRQWPDTKMQTEGCYMKRERSRRNDTKRKWWYH